MYQSNLVSFTTYSHSSVRLTSAYLPRAFPTEIMCLFLYSHASYIPPLQTPKFNYPNASTAPPPPVRDFLYFRQKKMGKGFLFATVSRPALGPIQPPIQWVQESISTGIMRPGRETDHLSPFIAEVKNTRSYSSTPPYVFMVR
jgi:hypothetical protein